MKDRLLKQLAKGVSILSLCFISLSAFAAPWDWDSNYGQVARLYPTEGRTYFQLKGGQTAMAPRDGYYYIPASHSNYQALIDLLYKAGEYGWTLHARTQEQLDANQHAVVIYLVVNY